MKRSLIISALIFTISPSAFAQCVGSSGYSTCWDAQGNSYSVQRYGNTTITNGHNAASGSRWNQTSTNVGGVTFHNGTSADGNSWRGSSQRIGDTLYNSGTDSRGRSYRSTCNQFGCY